MPNHERKRTTCLLKTETSPEPLDEAAAYEASSLVSGSFVESLHRALWLEGQPMQAVTTRLESLYDNGEHHAFLYLVILMASAVELALPEALGEIAANEAAVPSLPPPYRLQFYHHWCEILRAIILLRRKRLSRNCRHWQRWGDFTFQTNWRNAMPMERRKTAHIRVTGTLHLII